MKKIVKTTVVALALPFGLLTWNSTSAAGLVTGTHPTTYKDCTNGGWKTYANPSFKNQGQCVVYVLKHRAG